MLCHHCVNIMFNAGTVEPTTTWVVEGISNLPTYRMGAWLWNLWCEWPVFKRCINNVSRLFVRLLFFLWLIFKMRSIFFLWLIFKINNISLAITFDIQLNFKENDINDSFCFNVFVILSSTYTLRKLINYLIIIKDKLIL